MSFFDRENIPDYLLYDAPTRAAILGHSRFPGVVALGDSGASKVEDVHPANASTLQEYEHDICALRDYSLISATTANSFELHVVVQVATRQWLRSQEREEERQETFFEHLLREVPRDLGCLKTCRALSPHAEIAALEKPCTRSSRNDFFRLLVNLSLNACFTKDFYKAETWASRGLESARKIFWLEMVHWQACSL